MSFSATRYSKLVVLLCALAAIIPLGARMVAAADHGDAPLQASDRQGDIGDVFFFLDPNDNSKLILAMTVQGFIVPGEAVNFAFFDHRLRYQFQLETTGDAIPDHFIQIQFSEKNLAGSNPQTATVTSTFFDTYTAPTTVAVLSAAPGARTLTPASGTLFFAGVVDDPFFFDIPAFARFIASVNNGAPNPGVFSRGRDSFAGYDTLAIMLSVPVAALELLPGQDVIGVDAVTFRPGNARIAKKPVKKIPVKQRVDRAGNPAVNVALIPYARKNEYNLATTKDDAAGRFAADIVGTLQKLGTNQANIDLLAGIAVAKGDFLRLSLSKANSGPGGGNNAGAGFPNGRRLGDDTIDTILTVVNNNAPFGDNVNSNELPLLDSFPFFALPHQPRDPGAGAEDQTRN